MADPILPLPKAYPIDLAVLEAFRDFLRDRGILVGPHIDPHWVVMEAICQLVAHLPEVHHRGKKVWWGDLLVNDYAAVVCPKCDADVGAPCVDVLDFHHERRQAHRQVFGS